MRAAVEEACPRESSWREKAHDMQRAAEEAAEEAAEKAAESARKAAMTKQLQEYIRQQRTSRQGA